jgi:hypothetical protein
MEKSAALKEVKQTGKELSLVDERDTVLGDWLW